MAERRAQAIHKIAAGEGIPCRGNHPPPKHRLGSFTASLMGGFFSPSLPKHRRRRGTDPRPIIADLLWESTYTLLLTIPTDIGRLAPEAAALTFRI